jgi:hypothetical protein
MIGGPAKTVKEIIELLQTMPADAMVTVEGCDCIGPCAGASQDGENVLLERQEWTWDEI